MAEDDIVRFRFTPPVEIVLPRFTPLIWQRTLLLKSGSVRNLPRWQFRIHARLGWINAVSRRERPNRPKGSKEVFMFGTMRLRPVSRDEMFGPFSRQFDRMLNDVFGQDFTDGVKSKANFPPLDAYTHERRAVWW